MSMFPFLKNFVGTGGQQAAEAAASALVKLAPETATRAELATMEEDLDKAGRTITKLQTELADENRQYDAINAQYSQMMSAAEVLQKQIDDPNTPEDKRNSLAASLANLLGKIETIVPELDRDRQDVEATQALLKDAEEAYQEKAVALTQAKSNLDRAKHDMQHAAIEEDRAKMREDTAKVVAGLKTGPSSGLNVALDSMQKSAQSARERAAASNMKAKALTSVKDAGEDPNIKAAMAAAAGTTSEKSLSDRLAALKR